jgi:hypothetical protein
MPCEYSPGFRFKQGKLYAFTENSLIVLERWPVLRALRKTDGEPWTEFAPQFHETRPAQGAGGFALPGMLSLVFLHLKN